MASYKGRTFTARCAECGDLKTSTHQYKADTAADLCYDSHFNKKLRSPEEILQDLRDHLGDDYPNG